MICLRCVIVVKSILGKLNIAYTNVEIGKVEIVAQLEQPELARFQSELLDCELSLTTNRKCTIAEDVKNLIRNKIRAVDIPSDFRFSDYLSSSLHYDYTYLANVFTEIFGTTIEKFYIEERIKRVKELITYGELTITEISYQLNFSSVPHLCSQFKKITGVTTAEYKNQINIRAPRTQQLIKKYS